MIHQTMEWIFVVFFGGNLLLAMLNFGARIRDEEGRGGWFFAVLGWSMALINQLFLVWK